MHEKVDVFICGSGSAGLSAATWLARCGVRCKIVDSRPGPLEVGQADGIQNRTTEIFESFGIVEDLLKEGFHNLEVAFWNPVGKGGGVERTRIIEASYQGMSHLPRLILSQARVHDILLGAMKRFNGQDVDYGYTVLQVKVDEEKANEPESYPVTVVTEKDGKEKIFEAKFALVHLLIILGCRVSAWNRQVTVFRAVMVHTVPFEGHLVSKWLEMGLIQCGVSWISSLAPTSRTPENSP